PRPRLVGARADAVGGLAAGGDAACLPQRPLELVDPERPRPRRPRALRAVDAGRHDGSAAAPGRLLEGHDPALTPAGFPLSAGRRAAIAPPSPAASGLREPPSARRQPVPLLARAPSSAAEPWPNSRRVAYVRCDGCPPLARSGAPRRVPAAPRPRGSPQPPLARPARLGAR